MDWILLILRTYGFLSCLLWAILYLINSVSLNIKTKKGLKDAGDQLEVFHNHFTSIILNICKGILLISIAFLSINFLKDKDYLEFVKVLLLSLVLCCKYLIVIIRKMLHVRVFESGILFKGRYLNWEKIKSIEVTSKNRIIVYSNYLTDSKMKSARIIDEIPETYFSHILNHYEEIILPEDKIDSDAPFVDLLINILFYFKDKKKMKESKKTIENQNNLSRVIKKRE